MITLANEIQLHQLYQHRSTQHGETVAMASMTDSYKSKMHLIHQASLASNGQMTQETRNRAEDQFEGESEMEIIITPSPIPPIVFYGPPPIAGAPPSYSAVMRIGSYSELYPAPGRPRRREVQIQPSPPFIAPTPPPSYAEAQGYYVEGSVVASGKAI